MPYSLKYFTHFIYFQITFTLSSNSLHLFNSLKIIENSRGNKEIVYPVSITQGNLYCFPQHEMNNCQIGDGIFLALFWDDTPLVWKQYFFPVESSSDISISTNSAWSCRKNLLVMQGSTTRNNKYRCIRMKMVTWWS